MSRLRRDVDWDLVIIALAVAALLILTPIAWWQSRSQQIAKVRPKSRVSRQEQIVLGQPRPATSQDEPGSPSDLAQTSQPQAEHPQPVLEIADVRPAIAAQIRLDPSITETPALPAETAAASDEPVPELPRGELRLSANRAKPVPPIISDPSEAGPLRQPSLAPEPSLAAEQIEVAPATKAWPSPSGLIEQLNILAATTPQAADWANKVKLELDRLAGLDTLTDPVAKTALVHLQSLADNAKVISGEGLDIQARSRLLRAGYSLVRRLVVWGQVHTLAANHVVADLPVSDESAWNRTLAEVDAQLQATGAAAHWRKYLLIDQARERFHSQSSSPADQRQLARDILYRMHSPRLSAEQEKFLQAPELARLVVHLKTRACESTDLTSLLRDVEAYEHSDRWSHGRALATRFDGLRWSTAAGFSELADTIALYYRNANVRVALSADLVNRVVPQQNPRVQAVEEVILGAWVFGQSQTNMRLQMAPVPDPQCWNIGLEALGEVASNTSSSKGPAVFYQNGVSMFRVRKRIVVNSDGIHMHSAEGEANANNYLGDFQTEFDGIPLLGGVARSIARNQYDANRGAAKAEVEGRIVGRATSQLDREVENGLERAKKNLQAKFVAPLERLNLEPTTVDLETTADRLIGRYRVASREQVAAHTPRPQAPGDSTLSLQIHESAFNNALENLDLNGRRVELRELYKELNDRFRSQPVEIPEDFPESVHVTFADEDCLRLDCQDGRVRLTIRIKELSQGTKNRWTNFTVRGYYAPSADQLDANLAREGIIELIADKGVIGIGDQIALRGIFARVLSRNRKIHIINKQIADAPALRDQQVTQFVIHDGWMGIALGPRAPGREAALHPRPALRDELREE